MSDSEKRPSLLHTHVELPTNKQKNVYKIDLPGSMSKKNVSTATELPTLFLKCRVSKRVSLLIHNVGTLMHILKTAAPV